MNSMIWFFCAAYLQDMQRKGKIYIYLDRFFPVNLNLMLRYNYHNIYMLELIASIIHVFKDFFTTTTDNKTHYSLPFIHSE